jgi:exonuclease VII large subunit
MPVTEESRHRLHQKLDQTIGPEEATTLMEHLPPTGWADIATKQDLDNLRTATKTDLDNLRTATKTDLDNLRTATKTDLDNLEERLDVKIDRRYDLLDAKIDSRYNLLDAKIDRRFETVDQRFETVDQRFEKVDLKIDGLKDLILALGKKIDTFDLRFEAQAARTDLLFWQFVGLIVTVCALVFTGIKLFGG